MTLQEYQISAPQVCSRWCIGASILHPPQQLDSHPKLVRQQPVAVETTNM